MVGIAEPKAAYDETGKFDAFAFQKLVAKAALSSAEKHVLLTMSGVWANTGQCFPSIKELAEATNRERANVVRIVGALRAKGWLVRTGLRKRVVIYRLCVPEDTVSLRHTTDGVATTQDDVVCRYDTVYGVATTQDSVSLRHTEQPMEQPIEQPIVKQERARVSPLPGVTPAWFERIANLPKFPADAKRDAAFIPDCEAKAKKYSRDLFECAGDFCDWWLGHAHKANADIRSSFRNWLKPKSWESVSTGPPRVNGHQRKVDGSGWRKTPEDFAQQEEDIQAFEEEARRAKALAEPPGIRSPTQT